MTGVMYEIIFNIFLFTPVDTIYFLLSFYKMDSSNINLCPIHQHNNRKLNTMNIVSNSGTQTLKDWKKVYIPKTEAYLTSTRQVYSLIKDCDPMSMLRQLS